jgi:hypothetical protein
MDRRSRMAAYSRGRAKLKRGAQLTYTERQVLADASERRRKREEASALKDQRFALRGTFTSPYFSKTKYGWRVVVPSGYMDHEWSTHDEIEVVTSVGTAVWVTLVRLAFQGGDENRRQWWTFSRGRRSLVAKHEAPAFAPPTVAVEDKSEKSWLDDDDDGRATTGAGAAYLNARRKKAGAQAKKRKKR